MPSLNNWKSEKMRKDRETERMNMGLKDGGKSDAGNERNLYPVCIIV